MLVRSIENGQVNVELGLPVSIYRTDLSSVMVILLIFVHMNDISLGNTIRNAIVLI